MYLTINELQIIFATAFLIRVIFQEKNESKPLIVHKGTSQLPLDKHTIEYLLAV